MPGDVVLEVKDLHTYFFNRRGITKAVDGVSFTSAGRRDAGHRGRVGLRQDDDRPLAAPHNPQARSAHRFG